MTGDLAAPDADARVRGPVGASSRTQVRFSFRHPFLGLAARTGSLRAACRQLGDSPNGWDVTL